MAGLAKHITESEAIELVKGSVYGGLEQLALHIYSLTTDERNMALNGTPEKAAHLLGLPVETFAALRRTPSYIALMSRYRRTDTFSLTVQEEIEGVLLEKMRSEHATVPEVVRGLSYFKEGLGIAEAPASVGGGVTVNVQQNNYYGGQDAFTAGGAGPQTRAETAEEAIFRPLVSGGLPPESVRELPERTEDQPLFLHREDRHV